MIGRIVIDDVRPRTPTGRYPAKAVIGEAVTRRADVFKDGHDLLAARVRWRPWQARGRARSATRQRPLGGDRADDARRHELVVEAWTDRYATLAHEHGRSRRRPGHRPSSRRAPAARAGAEARRADRASRRDVRRACTTAGSTAGLDDAVAARRPVPTGDVTEPHPLWVDRERALVRRLVRAVPPLARAASQGARQAPARRRRHGLRRRLPAADPPDRPHRTARAATTRSSPARTTPAARGPSAAAEGGHTAVHPELGTLDDFDALRGRGRRASAWRSRSTTRSSARPTTRGCTSIPSGSTTGPTARSSTPRTRPRSTRTSTRSTSGRPRTTRPRGAVGGVQGRSSSYWIGHGVRIFRVDNPHTKPHGVLGVGDRRRCRPSTPTCSSWPRRSPARR